MTDSERRKLSVPLQLGLASHWSAALVASGALALQAPAVAGLAESALPQGGQVVAGKAAISTATANLNIEQQTPRAIIEWDRFNIGAHALVTVSQPGPGSALLNRVIGGSPSEILGRLRANGQVFITNGSGIYFGPGSSVDVGALVATTHDILNEDFMRGKLQFDRQGSQASVVNRGEIIARLQEELGGFIAMMAPEVRNEGVIIARLGTVALAAGERITLQVSGSRSLTNVTVTPSQLGALVENRQLVVAPGGLVILSAHAANVLQGGVVTNAGRIEATGMALRGGRIVLEASHQAVNTGTLDASGRLGEGPAGEIHISAPDVIQNGALLAAAAAAAPMQQVAVQAAGHVAGDGSGGWVDIRGDRFLQGPTGVIDVSSIIASGGEVRIQVSRNADVAGLIDASSALGLSLTGAVSSAAGLPLWPGAQGGRIDLSSGSVLTLRSAVLDASGVDHGGSIRAEGSRLPTGPEQPQPGLPDVALLGATELRSGSRRGRAGSILVLGDGILLADQTQLLASGALGGGDVRVGGGWQGQDLNLANAQRVLVGDGASLQADALQQGDGGTVVVWADGSTRFGGRISATGGPLGGDGGKVEVSGKQGLGFTGRVDTSAPLGQSGLLLLDPDTLTVTDGSSGQTGTPADWSTQTDRNSYVIPETVLEAMTGNVVLTATTDIIINKLSDHVLNLKATNISFLANDESTASSSGGFTMRDIHDTIRLSQGTGSTITFQGGNVASANTVANSNAAFTSASIFVGNVETSGASVVFNTKRSSAATPMVVNGTITTKGGSITVAPGTRFGLVNSNAVDVELLGAVDTGGGSFTSNMTGAVKVNGGLNLGVGSATFGGTGTQINSLVQSTSNITVSAPLSFGAGAGISTSGVVTFNSTATMLAGGSLTLTASNFAFNSSFSGNSADITLRPYDATTNVNVGAAGSGGMTISSAALAQLSNFSNITIGRSDGTGTTTVAANTSISASAWLELVNQRIDITGGRIANTSGGMRLTGNQVNVSQAVQAQGATEVKPLDTGASLSLAVSGLGKLGGNSLLLGTSSDGPLVLSTDVATTASSVVLRSGGGITASAGGVAVAGLGVEAGGAVTLTADSFNFTTLALNAGGNSYVRSSQVFAIGAVSGINGISAVGHAVTLETTGSGSVTANQPINAGSLALLGSGAGFTLTGATHSVGTLAASTGGAVALRNTGTLVVGQVGSTNGVNVTGTVDLATLSGNLQIDRPITTAASSTDAVVLNAGRNSAAGTVSGGDIVVGAQGSVQTGSGGRATLYTGSLAGSSLGSLAVSGSGRFRYNSDEASVGYDTTRSALGSGVQVLYRERPTLSVGFAAASATYGDSLPAFVPQITGDRNGDAALNQVSGTATVTVAGVASGAGHKVVGQHDVGYTGGLSSILGYAFADDASRIGELTISPKALTVTGSSAAGKTYDGSTTASIAVGTLSGFVGAETVTASASGSFDSQNAGPRVATAVYTLGNGSNGGLAGNYMLATTTVLGARIAAKTLTVAGSSAVGKTYDGTTAASIVVGTLSGFVGTETVRVSALGSFDSKNAGLRGATAAYTLGDGASGGLASNYTLASTTGLSATITPKSLTVTGIAAQNKTYDGTTVATLVTHSAGFSGMVTGDQLSITAASGTFSDKNAGASKTVSITGVTLGGVDATNYTLASTTGLNATITPKSLTATGSSVAGKTYDGTTAASIVVGTLSGFVGAESVTASASGSFDGKDAGLRSATAVYTLGDGAGGGLAGNYTLPNTTGLPATITPKSLTVTGSSAAGKT